MKVCVLQPDYSTSNVDYKNYDPARDLTPWLAGHEVDHVLLNKLTTYAQLRELQKKNYDIFVNLCEGYLEWGVPSIDVIYSLELLNMPYTGPTTQLYDPPKELMKYVAYTEGVSTPLYALLDKGDDINTQTSHLKYPLFIKPAKAGDSLGIDVDSLVLNKEGLLKKAEALWDDYGSLLVEEYVDGREFTVLVAADPENPNKATAFRPVEYVFPEGKRFKTYSLKTSELHPECNIPVSDPSIEKRLREAAIKIFKGFGGLGYGRLDFRMQEDSLYFLEINFTCSVFYADGYEGSADYILKVDGSGQQAFLEQIIKEGIARHRRKQKKYIMKGSPIAGFGIYARFDIKEGDIIFPGEEKAQRIATRKHIESTWASEQIEVFKRYAYPLSNELFILWDEDPSGWAPQNHSCNPNTSYKGLNVVAMRNIKKGEELTLDYSTFLGEHMEPFNCTCGEIGCKGYITGTLANSVTSREMIAIN